MNPIPLPARARPCARLAPGGLLAALLAGLLSGCASLSPDGGRGDVATLAQGRTAGVEARLPSTAPDPEARAREVAALLAEPLNAQAAVQIALLNNPGLDASLAALGVSDAERVQAGRLPNPHLALGRFNEGTEREIERLLTFNVLGLVTLPWRAEWQGRQFELAKLQAAQDVVRLAADTRRAWLRAVAAEQATAYLAQVEDAAQAGAELARRMARAGNWSALRQSREQALLAEARAQQVRARQAAQAAREQLARLLGLEDATQLRLAGRLPELPAELRDGTEIEAQALRERLDVRSAVAESRYVADSLGFVRATGYVDALTLGYQRNTTFDNASGERRTKQGWEVELPLPIFDWGQARNARAQAIYLQSAARVREVGVRARSEARQAWQGYSHAYTLARHYRDEVVPLQQQMQEETLLRYNGMLASVWDLLAQARAQMLAVSAAIDAQRDFWLAETDLQLALNATSPGTLAAFAAPGSAGSPAAPAQGH